MVQPVRSPDNPGTTVVSIGHLTPWPEKPGYRTQVWDNENYGEEDEEEEEEVKEGDLGI